MAGPPGVGPRQADSESLLLTTRHADYICPTSSTAPDFPDFRDRNELKAGKPKGTLTSGVTDDTELMS